MKRLRISPAHILSRYIIDDIALASDPSDSDDWPMYISSLPDGPQVNTDCAVVYDTSGIKDGRYMSGEVIIHPGIQIRVRSRNYDTAYNKIEEIALALDAIQNNLIIIGAYEYKILNASRTTPIICIGVDDNSSTKRRSNFTSNFLLTLTLREIQNYIKVLNESIGIEDIIVSSNSFNRNINESIGIEDDVSIYDLDFTATTGTFSPDITFSSGTVDVYVNGSIDSTLTSGAPGSISVTLGDQIGIVISAPTAVTELDFSSEPISGDIDQFALFTNCTTLRLSNCSLVTGDLSDLSSMSLTSLNLFNCSLATGDLSDLSSMSLTYLNLFNCSLVTGDLSDLSSMSLTSLYLTNCSLLTGDLSDLSSMSLMYMTLFNCALLTGDLSDLSSMSLTYLNLSNCSLVTWVAEALDAQIIMTTCNMSNMGLSESDTSSVLASLIINEAAGLAGRNCTVTLTENSVPNAQGLADKATLVDIKGWTVATDV